MRMETTSIFSYYAGYFAENHVDDTVVDTHTVFCTMQGILLKTMSMTLSWTHTRFFSDDVT